MAAMGKSISGMDKLQGHGILAITVIIMCIILVAIFLLYIQINSCIYNVKSDLFYIAQNAYIAANSSELAYSNYEIDDELLQEKITEILVLNHPKYKFVVNKIQYEYISNNVLLDINLLVEPIVLNKLIGNISLNIKENVKLKLMEVK
jgi:cell division protein FtsL